ncbi:hypothetical protein SETIT_8G156600v2 [Setaria italica]|uniref:Uncharacterized protein n=1 Tax=Setaria italica TaxID=4555 RepID=A0A368S851_SETIT|nr:hypothetical protein SETIT_8G156600v2 [Setaria italica]
MKTTVVSELVSRKTTGSRHSFTQTQYLLRIKEQILQPLHGFVPPRNESGRSYLATQEDDSPKKRKGRIISSNSRRRFDPYLSDLRAGGGGVSFTLSADPGSTGFRRGRPLPVAPPPPEPPAAADWSPPAASSGDTGLPGASAAAAGGTFGGWPRRAGAGAGAGDGSAVVAMAGDAVGAGSCGGGGEGKISPRKGRETGGTGRGGGGEVRVGAREARHGWDRRGWDWRGAGPVRGSRLG